MEIFSVLWEQCFYFYLLTQAPVTILLEVPGSLLCSIYLTPFTGKYHCSMDFFGSSLSFSFSIPHKAVEGRLFFPEKLKKVIPGFQGSTNFSSHLQLLYHFKIYFYTTMHSQFSAPRKRPCRASNLDWNLEIGRITHSPKPFSIWILCKNSCIPRNWWNEWAEYHTVCICIVLKTISGK